jgi:septal ring factor EnvC (AmiA/AmiB activator)
MSFFHKAAVAVSLLALFVCSAAFAEQPDTIVNTIDQAIKTRKQTVKKAGDWQAQKERLKSKYYQLKESLEVTSVEIAHMKEIVAKQDAYMARTNNKIIEMEKMRQKLVPYLTETIARMEESINNDLPFLRQERSERVANLKEILADPEVTLAEKLRRVFEGLRVEMDYGKSVETTKEEVNYQGQKLSVHVLRLGRTALLMQTLDEQEVGIYNGKGWEKLPGRYNGEIKKAMDITQRRRPVDFVNLPIRGVAQ